ncbi:MAG: pirin family protein [Flavobacteriaceae bacterium]|nr:pirin family protein [Flavobacteriaceae bacterium]
MLKKINYIGESPWVNMGDVRLKQPLPAPELQNADPFLLLHHYGPYAISMYNNAFDVGAHPHRGFEPITILLQGEQLHKDSMGNELVVEAGDVQWTTAGRGIVHSEGPTKRLIEEGGDLEGIQLWLNLPAAKKMIPANYQHIKAADIPVVAKELLATKIIAGRHKGVKGPIVTQTPVQLFLVSGKGTETYSIPEDQAGFVYLVQGEASINQDKTLRKGLNQMLAFATNGNSLEVDTKENSILLIGTAEPLNEKVAQFGPYVMNSQTEIMEAMRDYQMGKMGYLY